MIVTIHQPMHFPYMGFFQKMKSADLFILLDDVQFSKNDKYSFYNRNKFKNSSGSDEWFTVPVEKRANKKLIKDVLISEDFALAVMIQIIFISKLTITSFFKYGYNRFC